MCTYITQTASILGSAKGPKGWMRVDRANVYYDHPVHAPLDHALNIDFVDAAGSPGDRVAVELSAASARALVEKILAALECGEAAHDLARTEDSGLRTEQGTDLPPAPPHPLQ